MKDKEKVYVNSRTEWRNWLTENYEQTDGIWLVTYKKHVPDKYVTYDEIVEEALCFGWVDSLPRKLDADRSMLYISPRRKGSPWSRLNKTRVAKLTEAGLMTSAGQALIDQAQEDGTWTIYDAAEDLIIPDDLQAALDANPTAKEHFEAFSDSSKKGILWWIISAKRDATRQKRIKETVDLAEQNIKANHPRQ